MIYSLEFFTYDSWNNMFSSTIFFSKKKVLRKVSTIIDKMLVTTNVKTFRLSWKMVGLSKKPLTENNSPDYSNIGDLFFTTFVPQSASPTPRKHSSEIRGLCLKKCSSETLQNLPYFWNTKTQVNTKLFLVFHFVLVFSL